MTTKTIKRIFKYDKLELTDPNADLSPTEVKRFYSNKYPELTTANVVGPDYKNNVSEYRFENSFKPKG